MSARSTEEIEARLAELHNELAAPEAERRELLRLRRPRVAGLASGRSRQGATAERNQRIRAEYAELKARSWQTYGLIKKLAIKHGLSSQQISRILAEPERN